MSSTRHRMILNLHQSPAPRWASTVRLLALTTIPLLASPLSGQLPRRSELVPGALFERVTSVADSAQQYAVYLPTSYDSTRRAPLLIVMDPRGRALLPLELLRTAADRFGWVIFSSYNSRSDVAVDPNRAALNAMLADAQRLVRVDARRLYLVGFSGTARQAWEFADQLGGHVAGILGFGAGFPPQWSLPDPAPGVRPPAFYGGAGNRDFNFDEMMALDSHLDATPVRHHFVSWSGPHGWPPAEVMHHGVEWLELQAIQQQLRPADAPWVDSLYQSRLDSARTLESAGDRFGAWQRYRWMQADFHGVRDTHKADSAVTRLGTSREVRRGLGEQQKLATRSREYLRTLGKWLEKLHSAKQPPAIDRALQDLSIARLQREARETTDTTAALAADRLLEYLFVLTSFYETQAAFDAGDPARARLLLDLADTIRPDVPAVCTSRKKALAQLGQDTTAAARPCTVGVR